jgi:hypothetical protein
MHPCPVITSHWWNWYPPVGCFVALVAVLAFLYPIYAETHKVSKGKKAAWSIAVLVLVLLEIRSTKLDRDEHNAEQQAALCEQTNRFDAIAKKLETDTFSNQQHFERTMAEEDGILSRTERVGSLAEKNLRNVTGGTSFAYLVPFSTLSDGSTLILHNDGAEVLSSVVVTISRVTNSCVLEAHATCTQALDPYAPPPVEIGTAGPHARKPISQPIYSSSGGGGSLYRIRIDAQNGPSIEQIWLRRSAVHYGFAYRYNVLRITEGTTAKGGFNLGTENFQILKSVDWTEYSPSESVDGIHLYKPK